MTDRWFKGFEPWFLDASSAWARSNGSLEGDQLTDYFRTRLRYIDYGLYKRLSGKLAAETPTDSKVAVVDQKTSMALSGIHFVYMDVGCWAGDGKSGWTKHREFGLVHGYVVVLCSFSDEPDYYSPKKLNAPTWDTLKRERASTPFIDAVILRHPDFPPIQALLDNLSGATSLGTLRILGATMVSTPYVPVPARGSDSRIHVFIGDLHAPVATNSNNAHIIEGGRELLRGRLDVGALSSKVMPLSSKAALLKTEVDRTLDFSLSTSPETIDEWLGYYHKPSARTADIFQGAGQDLRTFVDYLRNFHESVWPLKVLQLGDFFDLWMGFHRGFKGSMFFKDNLVPHAMDFAKFWVERTLFNTDQSAHLTHLLTLSQQTGPNRKNGATISTHFLYGIHDNYRRFPIDGTLTVPSGFEHEGMSLDVFHAPWKYEEPGLWTEHGHQPDTANWDNDPTFGHGITQAAFVEPWSRSLEGFAGWVTKLGDGNQAPRTLSIQHAMKQCLLNHVTASEPCRGIYVMGHSHEPMLKRVELWPFPPYGYR
jgi:hypothetical protein